MTFYSYVVRYDVGFAPNPFYGACTLATCKPGIRAGASIGDWIMGTGSAQQKRAGRLVYAMQVDEILTFDEYWEDARFAEKRAKMRGSRKQAHGDNIYHHADDGSWLQEDSRHSLEDGTPNPQHVRQDTQSERVLIASNFVYFGGDGPAVPPRLREGFERDLVLNGRGYANRFSEGQVGEAVDWITSLGSGVQGRPQDWPVHHRARSSEAA